LSDGGLGVTLAECSFGPAEIGAQIDLPSNARPEVLIFHEAPSRILISTSQPKRIQAIADKYEVAAPVVGFTIEKGIEIRQRNVTLGSWEIAALKTAYEGAFESYVR
jgi:phosphoribosylformylglycinamidine synthase